MMNMSVFGHVVEKLLRACDRKISFELRVRVNKGRR